MFNYTYLYEEKSGFLKKIHILIHFNLKKFDFWYKQVK